MTMTNVLATSEGFGNVDWDTFIDDPSVLLPQQNNLTLNLGEPRIFKGQLLTGVEVECVAELVEPGQLMRMHKIWREPKGRDPYWLASYMVHGVKLRIEITDPKDGERISLIEYLRRIFNDNLGPTVADYTPERFREWLAAKTGMRPMDHQNLFGMQMGADEDKIDSAMELLLSHGAVDARDPQTNWGGIREAVAIPRERILKGNAGPLIHSHEIGAMDRKLTQSGQGFQDLLHASLENFTTVLGVVATVGQGRKALALRIEQNDQYLDEEEQRRIQGELDEMERRGRAYRSTWAGATPHYRWDSPAKTQLILTDDWDPVSIPGGRMNYVAQNGTEGTIDLWKPRKNQRGGQGEGGDSDASEESTLNISALTSTIGQVEVPKVIEVTSTEAPTPEESTDATEEVTVSDEDITSYAESLETEDAERFGALSDEEKTAEVLAYLSTPSEGDDAKVDPDADPFD